MAVEREAVMIGHGRCVPCAKRRVVRSCLGTLYERVNGYWIRPSLCVTSSLSSSVLIEQRLFQMLDNS